MIEPETIAQRFARETAQHEMTIAHDDGLYRHLRFRQTYWKVPYRHRQVRGMYWFDLITVPGSLIFTGDGETYAFSRITDMFEFFRDRRERVNPAYWGEKITDGQDRLTRYSPKLFRAEAARHLAGYASDPAYADLWPRLNSAWTDHMDDYDINVESEALRAAMEFRYRDESTRRDVEFYDVWEWAVRDHDWWFLWACHAIVWGINVYDAAKAGRPAPTPVIGPRPPTPPTTDVDEHPAGARRGATPPRDIVTVTLPS